MKITSFANLRKNNLLFINSLLHLHFSEHELFFEIVYITTELNKSQPDPIQDHYVLFEWKFWEKKCSDKVKIPNETTRKENCISNAVQSNTNINWNKWRYWIKSLRILHSNMFKKKWNIQSYFQFHSGFIHPLGIWVEIIWSITHTPTKA